MARPLKTSSPTMRAADHGTGYDDDNLRTLADILTLLLTESAAFQRLQELLPTTAAALMPLAEEFRHHHLFPHRADQLADWLQAPRRHPWSAAHLRLVAAFLELTPAALLTALQQAPTPKPALLPFVDPAVQKLVNLAYDEASFCTFVRITLRANAQTDVDLHEYLLKEGVVTGGLRVTQDLLLRKSLWQAPQVAAVCRFFGLKPAALLARLQPI